MFKLLLKDEDIIMKVKVNKVIGKKEIFSNFIGNLLTSAGGDIADNINIILTKDALYLEHKGHVSLGYAEETRNVDKIDINDINEFIVTQKENEELITIITAKKEIYFVRDNSNKDGLALALASIIKDIK